MERLVKRVNGALQMGGLGYSISSYSQCSSKVFLDLFNLVTESNVHFNASMDEFRRCEFIVQVLEGHLGVNLSHIESWCLISKQQEAVRDLLNILMELWTQKSSERGTWESTSTISSGSHDESHDPIFRPHTVGSYPLSHSSPDFSAREHPHVSGGDQCHVTRREHHVTGREHHVTGDVQYYALHEATDSEDDSPSSSNSSSSSEGRGVSSTGPCSNSREVLKMLYRDYLEDLGHSGDDDAIHVAAPDRVDRDRGGGVLEHPLTDEFPLLYLSPSTARVLHRKQSQHTKQLQSQVKSLLPSTVSRKMEEVQRKHEGLQRLLHKDLKHAVHMQKQKLEREHDRGLKEMVHANRMANARARRYFRDYELGLKRKLRVPRTSEEQTFIKKFEENTKVMQENTRARVKAIKERQEQLEEKVCHHLESVENCYKDQFTMMNENVSVKTAKEPFSKEITRCKRLKQMECEVQELQDAILLRRSDVQHFREVDAAALKLPLRPRN